MFNIFLTIQVKQVELLPPPLGEGKSYQASFCDLRPSLDWSVEDGWTVPTSKVGASFFFFPFSMALAFLRRLSLQYVQMIV